jgi:hypothetical protein
LGLLRNDLLLGTPLSLAEARSRLLGALRAPPGGGEPALAGEVEGWVFDVVASRLAGSLRAVGARGHLLEEEGETRVELVLRPARGVRRILGAGLLGLGAASVAVALASVAAVAAGALPIWIGALGWILPVAGGSGWLLLVDSFFQRGADETQRLLSAALEAEPRP